MTTGSTTTTGSNCDVSGITSKYTTCATSTLIDMGKQCDCIKTFVGDYGKCGGAYKEACENSYKKSFTSCNWDGMSSDSTSCAVSFGVSWLMVLAPVVATFWFA